MRWIDSDEEPPASAINFHKNLKVLIPLEGLIKAVEENERIEKNISKLTKESDSLSKQLNNEKTIILVSHDIRDFSIFDKVYEIKNQSIVKLKA